MTITRAQLTKWIADNERLPAWVRLTLPAVLYFMPKEEIDQLGAAIESYVDRIVAGDIESVVEEFRASGVLEAMREAGIADDFLAGVREDAEELRRVATGNARH